MSAPRILNACPDCARQYDVGHLDLGAPVRCECGKIFLSIRPKPHAPRALRCSACGGNLKDGAQACEYCAAEVTLRELRLDAVCPVCAARLTSGAHFCMECGTEILAQERVALDEEAACPRCEGALVSRQIEKSSVIECNSCGGLWVGHEVFDRLCARSEESERATARLGVQRPPPLPSNEQRVHYLPCPVCRDVMNRRNYGQLSGIIVDVCKHHGTWFDHTELERILAWVRDGGHERLRRREKERLDLARERASRAPIDMAPPARSGSFGGLGGGDIAAWIGLDMLGDLFDLF